MPDDDNRPVTPPEPDPSPSVAPPMRVQRRVWLPICLFLLTCVSTFWSGATGEYSSAIMQGPAVMAEVLARSWESAWRDGLKYMAAIMSILLAHEMGHFLLTLWHRIPASFPMFIPMPITPFGTMGAVIAMQGSKADRRELFDIGIAGPLAGLAVAVPVLCIGIAAAQPEQARMVYDQPLLMRLLVEMIRPDLSGQQLAMNPLLLAGWVGLLVTGLNMLPISQLDGGHVTYTLFRRGAHYLAHTFVFVAIVYIVATGQEVWVIMLALIFLIGVDHPPTANDAVPLGRARTILGYASLAIPVLCFPPKAIYFLEG